MAENAKKKASLTSRIASTCALIYFLCVLLTFGAGVAGLSSELAIIVLLLSWIVAPVAGVAAVVLGIISLCRLTPEEKSESAWKSGSTKGNALVGIILPPAIFVLLFVMGVVLASA